MKYLTVFFLLTTCAQAFAGKDVSSSAVSFVYQLDSDATVFEFQASVPNACGSSLYKVKSANTDVANRKFALVLSAFMGKKKLAFRDTELCEGGKRSVVSWVRLIN